MPIDPPCRSCNKTFLTVAGMKAHCRAKRHRAYQYICEPCNVAFISLPALESHMNSSRHAYDFDYSANSSILHVCNSCSKEFGSAKALSQHQESVVHRRRNHRCPFCNSMFKSPSGVAFHMESGCHMVTRHQVTAAVRAMEIVPTITTKAIQFGDSTVTSFSMAVDTAYSTIELNVPMVPPSFNGKAYQCHICFKTFRTLYSLSGHLNSAAHDDNEFRCPKCKREFKLISGFVQHLESRACGLAKTTQIEGYFNDLSGQFSRLLKA